ncbi:hypothetical protein CR513_55566, partial [Mucuna pruriens]
MSSSLGFKNERITTESGFVQPAIPKSDGYCDHWCMFMENFMKLEEYWSIVAYDIPVVAEGNQLSDAQRKAIDEATLKDMKAKNYLF